jgi:hypothetical protein
MTTIVVVDYGMGNLRSVAKAFEHVAPKARVLVSGDAAEIRAADRVVFPGQGAMPDCMRHLDEAGLREVVLEAARTKPLFGVCIGEQMLFDSSEEGDTPGLGLRPPEGAAHGLEPGRPGPAPPDVGGRARRRLLLLRAQLLRRARRPGAVRRQRRVRASLYLCRGAG